MAAFSIKDFSGTVPRLQAKYLQNNQATAADNLDMYSGALRSMSGNAIRKIIYGPAVGSICTALYLYDNRNFFTFWDAREVLVTTRDGDVDVVRSPIANNTYERVYWTGYSYDEQRPAWTDNTANINEGVKDETDYPLYQWDLRVPRPTQTPTVAYPGAGSPSDPDNVEDRTYVWTWVRRWNGIEEESAPSDPSSAISVTPGDTVEITLDGVGPALAQPLPQVRSPGTSNTCWTIYVYRTLSGVAGTEYQWVGEQSSWATDVTFDDSKLAEDLGDIIRTEDFGTPDDDLRGLTSMPNGILAAFKKDTNEVHFCEPYQPHAWPIPYQLMTEYPIVALASFGESLCVATTDAPYIITGIHPAAMSMTKLEVSQSCVSKRSMVDMGTFVVYASPDGLVAVGSGMAEVVTSQFFTKDEWQLLNPSSIHAVNWDNKYVAWYDATDIGGSKGGFIFDPTDGAPTLTWLTDWFDAAYSDTETDIVYVADTVTHNGGDERVIVEWNIEQIDGLHDKNHFPGFVSANFDYEFPAATLTGTSWDVSATTSPTNELRWTDPPQDYESVYQIDVTIASNTSDGTVTLEWPNTLWSVPSQYNKATIPAGATGTYTLHQWSDDTQYMFDYTLDWDDPGNSFEQDNSWVLWLYSISATTGSISVSDITITKLGPEDIPGTEILPYTWKSKTFQTDKPLNMAAGQIFGGHTMANPVKVTLFADGQKVFEKYVNDERPFRMPTGYLAEEFQVQFEGTTEITNFDMATSMADLKNA